MTVQITAASPGTVITRVPGGAVAALNAHKSREKQLSRGYLSSGIKIGEDNFPLWCNAVPMSIGAKRNCRVTAVKGETAAKLLYHVLNLIF